MSIIALVLILITVILGLLIVVIIDRKLLIENHRLKTDLEFHRRVGDKMQAKFRELQRDMDEHFSKKSKEAFYNKYQH